MKLAAQLARNSRSLAAADLCKKLAVGTLFLAAARVLGKSVFGQYVFLFTFIQIASLTTGSGLNTLAVRRTAEDKTEARSIFWEMLLLRSAMTACVVALLPLVAALIGFDRSLRHNLLVYSLTLFGKNAVESASAVFQGLEKMSYCARLSYVQWGSTLILGMAALAAGTGLSGQLLAQNAGTAIGMVWSVWWILQATPGKIAMPGFAAQWKLAKDSVFFNASAIFSSLYNRVDVVLLTRLKGDLATGIYGAAYRLFEISQLPPAALMSAWLPSLVSNSSESEKTSQHLRTLRLFFLMGLGIVIEGTILLPFLVHVVLGSQYDAAAPVARILIWAVIPMDINFVLNTILFATSRERAVAIGAICAFSFNLVADLIFIPFGGYWAASVITIFTELLLLGINLRFLPGYGRMMASILLHPAMLFALFLNGSVAFIATTRLGAVFAAPLCALLFCGSLLTPGILSRGEMISLFRAAREVLSLSTKEAC